MNAEQVAAFDKVKLRKNVLLTGAGGTGKSFVLKHVIKWCREQAIEHAVTASTGCAAYLISGRTIHSYLGIGLADKPASDIASYVLSRKPFIANKLRKLDLLIVDEISMINDQLLEKIDEYLRIIRKCNDPFGGIQLVLCGDFAQLPPTNGRFCFKSPIWKKSQIEIVVLQEMMRQTDDLRFQKILSDLRWGICTKETLAILEGLKNTEFDTNNGIVPTILYSKNINVDDINEKQYTKLVDDGAKQEAYPTKYSPLGKMWATSIKVPEKVMVCAGAQVVLTWNLSQDEGLINGSRGVVVSVSKLGPVVRFVNGMERLIEYVSIHQEDDKNLQISFMPIRLAYALTIHKSQGMTLDAVVLDLGKSIFEYGQAYTALSRTRRLENIKITDVRASSFKTHADVHNFYKKH
jgi:ATP-dependent DNA helicase PIF1